MLLCVGGTCSGRIMNADWKLVLRVSVSITTASPGVQVKAHSCEGTAD